MTALREFWRRCRVRWSVWACDWSYGMCTTAECTRLGCERRRRSDEERAS